MIFTAYAQSFTGTARITRTIVARDHNEAVRIASQQLEGSNYYLMEVK